MKTDGPLRTTQKSGRPAAADADASFAEVDARIRIPVNASAARTASAASSTSSSSSPSLTTRMKMQMNRKMNAATAAASTEDGKLLRCGIDQYRSLQNRSTPASVAADPVVSPASASTSTHLHPRPRGSADAAANGLLLLERKQYAAAVPYFTDALAAADNGSNHRTITLQYQRGLCYLQSLQYKPAIEDFSRVIQRTPKSADLFAKRGRAFAALGEHHAALLDYNEAIALTASHQLLTDASASASSDRSAAATDSVYVSNASVRQLHGLYLRRAQVYKALNNLTHALEDLTRAESSVGGQRDPRLYRERASLYLQCRQDLPALEALDRLVELQEEALEGRHFDASGGVGGLAGFKGKADSDLSLSGSDSDSNLSLVDVLLDRGKLLQRLAREEDAQERKDAELASVEQGLGGMEMDVRGRSRTSDDPPTPEPYRGLQARRLAKRALADFSRVLELEDAQVDALRLRGESATHLGRYEDALADFSRALELEPQDFETPMARASLFRQRGDLPKAVAEVSKVLEVNGFFLNGLFLRSRLLEELGDTAGAQKDLSAIIEAHFEPSGGSGGVTMELATSTKTTTTTTTTTGKAARMTSEVAARALLLRARLSLGTQQFEAAESDYSRILASFPNHMEAQLELQDTREKQREWGERQQQEAVAWLERNAEEGEGKKSKKKKKKKRKKKSSHVPAGYVLLEDEEEQRQRSPEPPKEAEEFVKQPVEASKEPVEVVEQPEEAAKEAEEVVEEPEEITEQLPKPEEVAKVAEEEVGKPEEVTDEAVAEVERVPTTAGMTRDEAWESMWDEETDDVAVEASPKAPKAPKAPKEAEAPVEEEEAEEEASASSDDGKSRDPEADKPVVLVDDKYLKKREKQLRKLRSSLRHAAEERDAQAITEALARAERKQMSDALSEDIALARRVLAAIAVEASSPSRLHRPLGSHATPLSSHPDKPAALVIRPIAYGHALQAAEQQQQQLRALQLLLQEKEAEIRRLRQPPESSGEAPTPSSATLSRLRTQFPVQKAAARQAEQLVDWMAPSSAADRARQQILGFVQHIVTSHYPVTVTPLFFAMGSYPMKTYLPTSDLDVCLLLPPELEASWHLVVVQALCLAAGGSGGGSGGVGGLDGLAGGAAASPVAAGGLLRTNTVRNVSFINADVKVIKCTIDNVSVDLTANRVAALGAVRLLDAMARRVGRQHLLQKSLILVKAWCTHESRAFLQAAAAEVGSSGLSTPPASVLGASQGAFSTYAVNTMVMALFNRYGDALTHPLQALYLFLDQLAEFPWQESALTLYGAVPLSILASTPRHKPTAKPQNKSATGKMDPEDVRAIGDALTEQLGAFDASLAAVSAAMFPIRACNIVDPLDERNNLGRSVSIDGFPVLKRAFRLARDRLAALLSKDEDVAAAFFKQSWQQYGRGDGWRPDLLIHPRQTWHAKSTTANGGAPATEEEESRRWEPLLPSLDGLQAFQQPYYAPGMGPEPFFQPASGLSQQVDSQSPPRAPLANGKSSASSPTTGKQ